MKHNYLVGAYIAMLLASTSTSADNTSIPGSSMLPGMQNNMNTMQNAMPAGAQNSNTPGSMPPPGMQGSLPPPGLQGTPPTVGGSIPEDTVIIDDNGALRIVPKSSLTAKKNKSAGSSSPADSTSLSPR